MITVIHLLYVITAFDTNRHMPVCAIVTFVSFQWDLNDFTIFIAPIITIAAPTAPIK